MTEQRPAQAGGGGRHWYLPTYIALAGGVVLAAVAYVLISNHEQRELHLEFELIAHDRITALQRELDHELEVIRATAAFRMAHSLPDERDFVDFLNVFGQRFFAVQAVGWAPAVEPTDLAGLEAQLRRRLPGFHIEQAWIDDPLNLYEPPLPFAFPLITLAPALDEWLGRDLAVSGTAHEALQRARDTERLALSGRLPYTNGPDEGVHAVLGVHPVFARDATEGERHASLEGFVVGVLHVGHLVEQALRHLEPRGVDILLYDESGSAGERFLYAYSDGVAARTEAAPYPWAARRMFVVGGRAWEAVATPSPAFYGRHAHRPRRAWAAAATVMLFSLLLAGYLRAHGRYSRRVERLLGALQDEVVDRRRIEQTLSRERDFRNAVFDTADAFVLVLSPDGRIAECNRSCERLVRQSSAALRGRPVWEVLSERSQAAAAKNLMHHISTSPGARRMELWVGRGKRQRMVDWTFRRLCGAHGEAEFLVATGIDITRRYHVEQALRRSDEQFRQLAENIREVFWISDLARPRLVYVSPAYEEIWGRSRERLRTRPGDWIHGVHPEDRSHVFATIRALASVLREQPQVIMEFRVVRPDGTLRWVQARGFPVRDDSGRLVRVAGLMEDVTERKAFEERLQHLAHYDVLTGLPNRALFIDRLDQALAHAQRAREKLAVFYVDLDDFKGINDTLGHEYGDLLLRQVARHLEGVVRAEDTVARIGGDEFTLLLRGLESVADATVVAEKIMSELSRPLPLKEHQCLIRVSVGIALYPLDAQDRDGLLRSADAAMYEVKHGGKQSFRFFSRRFENNQSTP
ncbi:diguanylate cyclase [Ectothiorhodospiraceae bacterium 2226]|nr:diguanylate cyclase [Ectothiorhodospiraceae bacterium 2226]